MSISGIETRAKDGFETYYTQKLWQWVPEYYRDVDGKAPADGALHALIKAYANVLAEIRRESERIWENSSVELADDWALSLIGGITGMPNLSTLNDRARRLVVANAVAYSRRKGTLALISKLIEGISGAEGHVVEAFRTIARMPHRLDMEYFKATPLLQQPQTGLPDMSNPRLREISASPLDETSHLPDFRPVSGKMGYSDIPNLHVHLIPFQSFDLQYPTLFRFDDRHFTLEPSGRDIPLFHSGAEDAQFAIEAPDLDQFPIPMNCVRFNNAGFMIDGDALMLLNIPQLAPLHALSGLVFRSEREFLDHVSDFISQADLVNFSATLVKSFILDSARKLKQLRADIAFELDGVRLEAHEVIAARLDNWGANWQAADWRRLAFDPQNGRLLVTETQPSRPDGLNLHEGRVHLVGAGAYQRETRLQASDPTLPNIPVGAGEPVSWTISDTGALRIIDNQTYEPVIPAGAYTFTGETHWEAQSGKRPYIRFAPDLSQTEIVFEGDINAPPTLEINGLWLGIVASNQTALLMDVDGNVTPPIVRLVFDGAFENVILHHVTLDPGGQRASLDGVNAVPIPVVQLAIEGSIAHLEIDHSITGPIAETRDDPTLLNAGKITIRDSIIKAPEGTHAIETLLSTLYMENCTVLGSVRVHRIYATNTIFDGHINVRDRQNSCLRYSAIAQYLRSAGPSRLPRQFECVNFEQDIPPAIFASTEFGQSDFAALTEFAPKDLLQGAENGSEIGVGNRNLWYLRKHDLQTMIDHFLPVSMMAHIHQDFTGEEN